MPVNPVTSTYTAPANDRIPTKTLGQDDFIKMLTTELANQDPMKPQDSSEMLAQLSQIGVVQSMTQMQAKLTQFGTDQQVTLAQSLINKDVQVQDSDGNLVTGKVDMVSLSNGTVSLIINNQSYPVSSLQSILKPSTS